MYPVIRVFKDLIKFRNAPPIALGETHVSHHICWPWDLDIFLEMNNGRTLTLFDIGRIVMFQRMGLSDVMRTNRLGGTIAGSSVRYRRRVRAFDRVEMRSRVIGWDDRFVYAEQSMWRKGECTSHALLRMAVTDRNGLVRTQRLAALLGDVPDLVLPGWAQAWSEAEAQRPWPPMQG
jgi:acyl-CoA thioesterase FadM